MRERRMFFKNYFFYNTTVFINVLFYSFLRYLSIYTIFNTLITPLLIHQFNSNYSSLSTVVLNTDHISITSLPLLLAISDICWMSAMFLFIIEARVHSELSDIPKPSDLDPSRILRLTYARACCCCFFSDMKLLRWLNSRVLDPSESEFEVYYSQQNFRAHAMKILMIC
jgi:hypothetical protein